MSVSMRADLLRYCRPAPAEGEGFGRPFKPVANRPQERDVVPVFFLKEALASPGFKDINVDALLAEAAIPPNILSDENGWITPEQFGSFWLAHVRATGEEFFGQHPRGMPAGSFTLLCHLVLSAPTLERALQRMLRYYKVLLADFEGKVVREGQFADVVFVEQGRPRTPFCYSTFLVMFLGVACWLIDRRIPLIEAEFRGSCPSGKEHYRRLFCDTLQFGGPNTRIRFDAEFLSMRPMRTEAQLKRFLRDSPQVLLTQYRSRDSNSARIWHELRHIPPEGWPGFDELAARLHTTSSTLRRRLEAEGISYQRIKDGVRRERAFNQLRLNQKSNAEIAEELGFGDPSTFYRAFRKWTGSTPNAFRGPPHSSEQVA